MATLTGYNPNVSLLPAGSGTIQHMSGGGMGMPPTANYNANASLLPSAGGEIGLYKGGADHDHDIFVAGAKQMPRPSVMSEQSQNQTVLPDISSNPIIPAVPDTPIEIIPPVNSNKMSTVNITEQNKINEVNKVNEINK